MTRLATDSDVTDDHDRARWLADVNLADPALAATLELIYLRPYLAALPSDQRSALDIGAHRGHVTGELLDLGFQVLAVEPQEFLADHLLSRFATESLQGRLRLQRCAASDHTGTAKLFVGSASTVCSLEKEWTTVAFPKEFRNQRQIDVPLRTAADLLAPLGWGTSLGFAKVDVEGHELQALRGLFGRPTIKAPCAVMFEANQAFPERAADCLRRLWKEGYRTFDLFVRWGIDPIAGQRFTTAHLPPAWREGPENFYANVIAYHTDSPVDPDPTGPEEFVREYQQYKAAAAA